MSGKTLPRGRSSPTFSTNLLSRSKQPRCSAPAPGRCWCGPALRRASCSVFFRRVSNRGAMASVCRSWSAGRILMRRSARRWLNVKRRSRSSRPGLLTSPATRRCRACVLLPYVRPVSPFALELHTILQRGRIPTADLNIHERAMLAPRGDRLDVRRAHARAAQAERNAPPRSAAGRCGRVVVHDGDRAAGCRSRG